MFRRSRCVSTRGPGDGRLAATILALLLPALVEAAPTLRRFETVGYAQGLSNLSVTALAQDREGFLWIGTEEGLNRFDGLAMRVFRHRSGDDGSLASNRISALLVTAAGDLWVGTRGGGLARFDAEHERFDSFRNDPERAASLAQDDVTSLAEDARGRLWIGTLRSGLDRLESVADGGRFVHLRHDPEATGAETTLADDRIRALLIDRKDRLWIGTLSGLQRMGGESPPRLSRFAHDPARAGSLTDDEIWSLAEDAAGSIWVGSWGGGVDRLDDPDAEPGTARFVNFIDEPKVEGALPDARVMAIAGDRRGTLWFGALDGGLVELTAEERERGRPRFRAHRHDPAWSSSIAADQVMAILEDRSGDLWFGTASGGVSRLDRRFESNLYLRHDPGDSTSMPAGGVGALFEDSRGLLWLGIDGGLVRLRADATERIDSFRPLRDGGTLPFREIYDIAEDPAGDLWFATIANGLGHLAAAEAGAAAPRFAVVENDSARPSALPTNAALALLVDRDGVLWVGSYRGLHRAERDASGRVSGYRHFRHDPDDPTTLSSDRISALAEAPDGALWVGCYFGLNRLDPATGRAKRFVPDPARPGALSYENVLALHFDRSGTLWVGTFGGGLDRFDPATETFEVFGVAEGLPSETVSGITSDENGTLWLATARGLVRFDPATKQVERLGVADGLLDESVGDVVLDPEGRLLLASSSGLLRMERPVPAQGDAPTVVLTGLNRMNEPVRVGGADGLLERALARTATVVFGPEITHFSFDFAALSFRDALHQRYRYRLAGHDAGWLESAGAVRRAAYSRVPPGQYRFEIAAANARGEWGTEAPSAAGIDVVVRPPWWRTGWARGAAVGLALLATLLWHRARLAALERTAQQLEKRVEERTVELAEANRRLELASRTDLLTGLANRRRFLERAENEFSAFRRTHRPFSILLADLDRFKAINDEHGHECGDQVLAAVGDTLREGLRERDLPVRWGGEEFMVLLPETDLAGAATIAEKLRATFESIRVLYGSVEVPVTVTIGVAEAAASETIERLAARADSALYAGKRNGRNRVERASVDRPSVRESGGETPSAK
ncbi:MAG: two-component regulator propeller domain-containing protein [Thermoanaerobaculia bacterium]